MTHRRAHLPVPLIDRAPFRAVLGDHYWRTPAGELVKLSRLWIGRLTPELRSDGVGLLRHRIGFDVGGSIEERVVVENGDSSETNAGTSRSTWPE